MCIRDSFWNISHICEGFFLLIRVRWMESHNRRVLIKSLLSAIMSRSYQLCSLIVTATFRWLSHQFLADCRRLQTQTPPRDDNLARRNCSLMLSIRRWLPTWWVQAPHQTSRKGSNLPFILRSQILNVLRFERNIDRARRNLPTHSGLNLSNCPNRLQCVG